MYLCMFTAVYIVFGLGARLGFQQKRTLRQPNLGEALPVRVNQLSKGWLPEIMPAHASQEDCITAGHDRYDGNFWDSGGAVRIDIHHGQLNESSTLVEIGGNVGDDLANWTSVYKPGRVFVFEALPELCERLRNRFTSKVQVVCVGLDSGEDNRETTFHVGGGIGVGHTDLDSTSSYGSAPKGSRSVTVKMRNPIQAFPDLGIIRGNEECDLVDMLHMNCEGCEYGVLRSIIDNGWSKCFRNLQLSRHWLPQFLRPWCKLQQDLLKTHYLVYNYPWVWESWRLRGH